MSLVLVLLVTTGLFIASSGRMVPAMALITASAAPRDRGGFMSMNAAVQHLGPAGDGRGRVHDCRRSG